MRTRHLGITALAFLCLQTVVFAQDSNPPATEGKGISWTVWCFDPEWGPTLIRNWNYELTPSGEFAKAAMHGQIE